MLLYVEEHSPIVKMLMANTDAADLGDKEYAMLLSEVCHLQHMQKWLGLSPLDRAVAAGHSPAVELLLDYGAKVDDVDTYQRTALHYACLYGHVDTARLLLQRGANVAAGCWSISTGLGTKPLHCVAMGCNNT